MGSQDLRYRRIGFLSGVGSGERDGYREQKRTFSGQFIVYKNGSLVKLGPHSDDLYISKRLPSGELRSWLPNHSVRMLGVGTPRFKGNGLSRINIEDSLFKDNRFIKLMVKHGGRRMALGVMVECYIIAQKFWLKFHGIPKLEWEKEGLDNSVIDVGLATVEDGIIYVHGSKEQFKWLEQKSEAGSHKKHRNQYKPKEVERPLTFVNGPEPLTLTPPLSLSLSLSSSSNSFSKTTTRTTGALKSRAGPGERFMLIWNECCGDLPRVKGLNESRKRNARNRWRENGDQKYWEEVVVRLAKSSFCSGKGPRGWIATFDWFLKPDTHLNAIEGKYDDRHSVNGKTDVEEHNRKVFERINAKENERDV